jgi:DNA-binding transcriptional MerR regulator
MSERIITLFGEEIVPEQLKAVGKSRAKKKPEEKKEEEKVVVEETPAPVEENKTFVLPEDWEGNKQYYSIGEVAELFKVKTSHIRFWTNEFKLKVRTTRKGDRLFTAEQVRELRAIHHLVKERGFTLSGAKAKLKAQNKMDVETIDLKQSLLQLRNKLLIIRNQLT